MKHIDPHFELAIRRSFSARLENYKVLRKWIEDAIGQIVAHDPHLYRHSTRIKDVSSVLRKVDDKIHTEKTLVHQKRLAPDECRWSKASVFGDVEHLLDDWVGCRVISYVQDALPSLHKQIIKHDRFHVRRVTIHDSHDHQRFASIKLRKGRDERRLNYNGYAGIHYVIEPITIDPCLNLPPHIFHKFELQIRTLLQETWSQVQHEVIYKGRLPDLIKTERSNAFAGLASFLAQCDTELSRLSKDATAGTHGVLRASEEPDLGEPDSSVRYVRPPNSIAKKPPSPKQRHLRLTPRKDV